ncbi:hypothetical protein WMF38_37165 [Sorangium sp. So ce118]
MTRGPGTRGWAAPAGAGRGWTVRRRGLAWGWTAPAGAAWSAGAAWG